MSDIASAKQAARRLYKRVNYQQGPPGPLGSYELSSLLSDTYEILKIRSYYVNSAFKATQNDIRGYEQVLDYNRDGKVTLEDLEAKAIEYLTTNTLISTIQGSSKSIQGLHTSNQTSYGQQPFTQSHQTLQTNQNNQATGSRDQTNTITSQNTYIQYSQNTYTTTQNNNQPTQIYNYNYQSSFPFKSEGNSQSLNNYASDTLHSLDRESGDRNAKNISGNIQGSERSFGNSYNGGDNQVNQSRAPVDNYRQGQQTYEQGYHSHGYNQTNFDSQGNSQLLSNQNYSSYEPSQSYNQQYQEGNYQEEGRQYSEAIREYLSVIEQVFLRYANPQQYTITQQDVPDLLKDTYAVLGRQGYEPSYDDVQTWMKLCDVNQDGKVEFQQYEYFVVKSLERSGLNLYD